MVKVNWNAFQSKFGEASPAEFERLCYLIFCRRYGKSDGIPRLRNQPALETSPIEVDGEFVGFQAKFFLGKVSAHKKDLKKAINDVASRYKNLKRLVLFVPMDCDCNQKAKDGHLKTKAQRELEDLAKGRGFLLEWFCHSNFEVTFSKESYKSLGLFFFTEERGLFNLFKLLDEKRDQFVNNKPDSICVRGVTFEIDRSKLREQIKSAKCGSALVLYGEGGVGKSGVITGVVRGNGNAWVLSPREFVSLFDAENLLTKWNATLVDVLDETMDLADKILVLDGAEHIEDIVEDKSLFYGIIRLFSEHGWRVTFTVRTMFHDVLVRSLELYFVSRQIISLEITGIEEGGLCEVEKRFGISLPNEAITRRLLRVPFYLDAYLRNVERFPQSGKANFKNWLWLHKVQDGNSIDSAAECFQRMIKRRLQKRDYWLETDGVDAVALKTLVGRGIIVHDSLFLRYYLAHDVYEEIAIERLIDAIRMDGDNSKFFERLSVSRSMIRAYRMWLKDLLESAPQDARSVVDCALAQSVRCWSDESLLAVITSAQAASFLDDNKDKFLDNGAAYLHRILRLVRGACKEPRKGFPLTGQSSKTFRYYFTQPCGCGWESVIDFVCNNADRLHEIDLGEIVNFIYEWVQVKQSGVIVDKVAKLAFCIALSDDKDEDGGFEVHYDARPTLVKIITICAKSLRKELREFIEFTLKNFDPRIGGLQRELYEGVIEHPFEHINFIKEFPDLTRRMAMATWFARQTHYYSAERINEIWGLSSFCDCRDVFPSAYSTPVYPLLQHDFLRTIDFIVEVVNKCIDYAAKYHGEEIGLEKTMVAFPTGEKVEQSISQAVWSMHRGVAGPVVPYLLQSTHMALERYMLELHDGAKGDAEFLYRLEDVAIDAIRRTRSASIAGALTSLVLAHPNDYYRLADILLTSRKMIQADHERGCVWECQCKSLYDLYPNSEILQANERKATLQEKFRGETLESVMLRYQVELDSPDHKRRMRMFALLDEYGKSMDEGDQFFVRRADIRKQRLVQSVDENGRHVIQLIPELTPELVQKRDATHDQLLPDRMSQGLMFWASAKIKGEKVPEFLEYYEENPQKAIDDFRMVLDLFEAGDARVRSPSTLAYAATALLYFCHDKLDIPAMRRCEDMLLNFARQLLNSNYTVMLIDGVDAAITALPLLIKSTNSAVAKEARYLLLLAMLYEDRVGLSLVRLCDVAFEAVRRNEWRYPDLGAWALPAYLNLRCRFQRYLENSKHRSTLLGRTNINSAFADENSAAIDAALSERTYDLNTLVRSSEAIVALGGSILLFDATKENADKYADLIVAGIFPVMRWLYQRDKRSGRLNGRHLRPFASQYQHQLSRLILHMEDGNVQRAIRELAKVPDVLSDRWFLMALINEEDRLGGHENFWKIWLSFVPTMMRLMKTNSFMRVYDNEGVLETYFFGHSLWKPNVNDWRSFKAGDVKNVEVAVRTFPPALGVLSAVASFGNGIGCQWWECAFEWLSCIIRSLEPYSLSADFPLKRAVDEVERFSLRVVLENELKIKRSDKLWNDVITVLDWLVDQQSNLGYQLREQVI